MFSKIFLSQENIDFNVDFIKKHKNSKICAMVKANAYGHGGRELTRALSDKVDYFGVSNQTEANEIRGVTDKEILVFGYCENYKECMENDISFAVFSYGHIKEIVKIAKENQLSPKMHLCINTGMNRYGVKSLKEFIKIIRFLSKNKLSLQGVYTHFSSLTTDEEYTMRQKDLFDDYVAFVPKEWDCVVHIGGGNAIYRDFQADMYRIGLEIYGYGNEKLKPILEIETSIVDIQKVLAGEHVGYMCGFTAKEKMRVATIPLGYGDGLSRKLSNKLKVTINDKSAINVGNICMDALMVDVTNIKCKIGDKVKIQVDATKMANEIGTTEYEVLTGFSKFRGERIVY